MSDVRWDPAGYLALMAEEVPDHPELQAQTVAATGAGARRRDLTVLVGDAPPPS